MSRLTAIFGGARSDHSGDNGSVQSQYGDCGTTYESIRGAFNEDGSLPEKGFRVVIEETKNALKVDREISFNEVADLSILREAQRELGIK